MLAMNGHDVDVAGKVPAVPARPQATTTTAAADATSKISPFAALADGQSIAHIASFTLESGQTLHHVPVAYKTWGQADCVERPTNVMVICHALTGSADVGDWWGPLLGQGCAFDPRVFLIVCANTLASPYGSASPCTRDPSDESCALYGPRFPAVTIRDTVRLHYAMMQQELGVHEVQVVVGGSMGGMQVLEWGYLQQRDSGTPVARSLVPIATSGRHSAWCISWGEAQRQAIYSDPQFQQGLYCDDVDDGDHLMSLLERQPRAGLAAARIQALLTYRSRTSFESRFGRKRMPARDYLAGSGSVGVSLDKGSTATTTSMPSSHNRHDAFTQHNEGNRRLNANSMHTTTSPQRQQSPQSTTITTSPTVFSTQSYLRYQGDKFVRRFDANCYVSLTRMLDTHDVSRGRGSYPDVLGWLKQPALIVGVESDGLFTLDEQEELHENMPNSELAVIFSPEGHDGFLLEFDQMNKILCTWLDKTLPENLRNKLRLSRRSAIDEPVSMSSHATPVKRSVFGEVETGEELLHW